MNVLGAFSRLRALIKEGATDPVAYYGTTYQGMYEALGSRIFGTVSDCSGNNRYQPAQVVVTREGEAIGSTDQFDLRANGWIFEIEFASPFTTGDILQERLAVFAVDRRGSRSKLMLDGAVQLSYVKELTAPSELELLIDFSDRGNSAQYRLDGWSGQEAEHIWTDGDSSSLALAFKQPEARYRLEILAWPFVVPDKIPAQTLFVSLEDTQIGKFNVRGGQNLLECDIPAELTTAAQTTLRFRHPDAAKPSDYLPDTGDRVMALAFRRITLRRYLDTTYDPFSMTSA
jgi:hypothetical protein